MGRVGKREGWGEWVGGRDGASGWEGGMGRVGGREGWGEWVGASGGMGQTHEWMRWVLPV